MSTLPRPNPAAATSVDEQAELAVADVIGRLMHFWGFKRPMGRVWSILYMSEEPLTAADLGEQLKMSAGAISMALSELEKWGAVERTWVPGDRRDFFTAEPDIWKLVRRVMKERELGRVRDFTRNLKRADEHMKRRQTSLESCAHDAEAAQQYAKLQYKRARLSQLCSLSETGENLLAALVDGDAINPGVLIKTSLPLNTETKA